MPKINQEEYKILKGLDDKWKWIARDDNRDRLLVYVDKPKKSSYQWLAFGYRDIDNTEFQFIQWTDEKPYNIDELTEEYEQAIREAIEGVFKALPNVWKSIGVAFQNIGKKLKSITDPNFTFDDIELLLINESEETEVKKDIEWLKEEVFKQDVVMGKEYIYTDDLMSILEELEVETSYREAVKAIAKHFDIYSDEWVGLIIETIIKYGKKDLAPAELEKLLQSETLSQEWIGNNVLVGYPYDEYPVVPTENLQKLLVPKQEMTDEVYEQGYKVGYKIGKLHKANEREQLEVAYKNILGSGGFGFGGKEYVVTDKPVIPQFVADWIEETKKLDEFTHDFINLIEEALYDPNTQIEKYVLSVGGIEIIADAYRHDYTVEKEPKYYAKVKEWSARSNGDKIYYSGKFPQTLSIKAVASAHTKKSWSGRDITDGNADFELVEDPKDE